MIPFWVRWVEIARFPGGPDADDLQEWLANRGIPARIRPHRRERAGVGTSIGYQVLPDRAPQVHLYAVEVRPDDLDRTREALRESGWDTDGYVAHWWLSQGMTAATLLIAVSIIISFLAMLRALGSG